MKDTIIKQLSKHFSLNKQEIESLIEVPPTENLGDYSFPCFGLGKILKKNSVEIAKELANKFSSNKNFEKVEANGPYLNFFLNRKKLAEETIKKILKEKDKYGGSKKSNKKIMIEFSQANTHKAFHVGHVRGTSLGESVARILEFAGDKVIRANYQGDA